MRFEDTIGEKKQVLYTDDKDSVDDENVLLSKDSPIS